MGQIKKRVSMQNIADHLGISKNSVSLALGGKTGVSDETRELVIKTAQQMQYNYKIPSEENNPKKLLTIIPEYIKDDSYFYNQVYWAIEMRAKECGHIAVLCSVTDDMQQKNELPSMYYELDFIGIITVGVLSKSYMQFLHDKTDCLVSVDHNYSDLNIDCILTANLDSAYRLTQYVIAQGHTEIGFVGSVDMTSSIFERWCGYQKAMLHAGLTINPKLSILHASPLKVLLSDPQELTEVLMQMEHLPSAFITGGDRIAISLMSALTLMGKQVPDDISVAGFDNIEATTMVTPALTTINVKRNLLGETAVNRLIYRSEHPDEPAIKKELFADIVLRDSVIGFT